LLVVEAVKIDSRSINIYEVKEETKMSEIEKLRKGIKDGICTNCGMRDIAVCAACQIDFEKALDQILAFIQEAGYLQMEEVRIEGSKAGNKELQEANDRQSDPLGMSCDHIVAPEARIADMKADLPAYCAYCGDEPDGAMLRMGNIMAHATCVIRKLNKLLDPDYEGKGEPDEVVGFLAKG